MTRLVLVNIGHHNRNPSCSRAAVRILGVFSDTDAIQSHVGGHSDVDLYAVPTEQWMVLTRDSGLNETMHLESLQSTLKSRLKRHAEEFESNRINHRTGQVNFNKQVFEVKETDNMSTVSTIQKEVRMQRF